MSDEIKCQGECSVYEDKNLCSGTVKLVHVKNKDVDWGEFYYCDTAIQEDIDNGFEVTVLEAPHA